MPNTQPKDAVVTNSDSPSCLCRSRGRRLCPLHQPLHDEITHELDTRELPLFDEDSEPTLRDEGVT